MIEMFCDHCEGLIKQHEPGGVRLKMSKKEYVFHLCPECQELLRQQIKNTFLDGRPWKELS